MGHGVLERDYITIMTDSHPMIWYNLGTYRSDH